MTTIVNSDEDDACDIAGARNKDGACDRDGARMSHFANMQHLTTRCPHGQVILF